MICQAVWAGDTRVTLLEWAQGINDVPIARVECWHSEWEDPDSPWTEWRMIDWQGKCLVRWRIREATGQVSMP